MRLVFVHPIRARLLVLFALFAASVLMLSCSKSSQPGVEAPPTAAVVPTPQTPDLPNLPPKLVEVQEAVRRVFKEAATIESSRTPSFVAGDFNGDRSEDIAVILKPMPGKLGEMNEEYPRWMLKDPTTREHSNMPRLRVEENELLLAVIHGYGPHDWRDPEATQTYLLKNAVSSQMQSLPGVEFAANNKGKKIPRLHGDLISTVIRGTPGYLYYSGASYSWYDPKTFAGEPEKRMVHARRGAKVY